MRQYVMHLARHLGPLQRSCFGNPAALLVLGPESALSERIEQRLASLGPLPPTQQRGMHGDVQYGVPGQVESLHRSPDALDEVAGDAREGDESGRFEWTALSDGSGCRPSTMEWQRGRALPGLPSPVRR